jgi:phage baseplate assembly protein W
MSVTIDKTFLGVGWSFPLQTDASGAGVLVEFEEDIRQAVLLILETGLGERVMRPDFGAGLQELVFEPLNTTTMALVQHRVEQALIKWEPRIDQVEVSVSAGGAGAEFSGQKSAKPRPKTGPNPRSASWLDIDIEYRIRATNTFYNLVYPFYLQEGRP